MVSHGAARHAVLALPTGAVFLSVSPLQPQSYTKSKFLTNILGGGEKNKTKPYDDNNKKKKKTLQEVKLTHRGGEVTAWQRKSVALACCYSRTSLCGRRFLTQGKTLCNAPRKIK